MPIASGSTAISKMYVGGTLVSAAYANSASLLFNPSSLFAASEQGAWYDPSDWTTMFQDAAGTTPVTAVGQPVGLMLDKRLGLVRGAELIPAPLNLTAGPWATLGVLSATATSMTNTSGAGAGKSIASLMTAGKTYEISCSYTKSDAATILSISTDVGVVILSSTAASGTLSSIFVNATAQLYLRLGGNCTVTVNNISVREIPGNHATQTTAINRPVLQIDGNGKRYLAFNGTNSWMSTPAINFTATDKMTVVAGVRRLSDGPIGMISEFGSAYNTPGSFYFSSPSSGVNFEFSTFGGAQVKRVVTTSASPVSLVVSATVDFSQATPASSVSTRLNGAAQGGTFAGAVATSGNFGNSPLYIGARVGTSLFFNGQLYSMIVRGALSTTPQITGAENFMNVKTGAY